VKALLKAAKSVKCPMTPNLFFNFQINNKKIKVNKNIYLIYIKNLNFFLDIVDFQYAMEKIMKMSQCHINHFIRL